ncbi:hypothetical protein GW626_04235 [Peribacillus muralis]|uniref:hypothetical protein n=1 Tax=Peribacillus muralis TaxID=264697 RepID=UPI001F4D7B2C|nr:hypothetical protein [Peribacillus muralis]MCK1993165.1 hypothetical protein [Peribacillus muralis]MCK2013719.1 hypothetical protein [Peribacillus muralis]
MRITFKMIYRDIDKLAYLSSKRNGLYMGEIESTRKRLVENLKAIEMHTIVSNNEDSV